MLVGANELLMLAVVLIAGVAFGMAARKCHLPSVTGQILVGILIGPSVLDLFGLAKDHSPLEKLQPITHFALGLIAVSIGSHLNIVRLRNAFKRLTLLLILEALLTPALVFVCVMIVPDTHWTLGIMLAATAIATAPATIIAIVKETRSKGVFVKTLIAAVALNNVACILIFEVAHTIARGGDPAAFSDAFLAPLRQLGAAVALGGGAGLVLVVATWKVVRTDILATASLIAILLTSGLADWLGVSSLLSCMFLGIALANFTPEKEEIGDAVFADFETAILAAFFTLAGMELNFKYLVPAGLIALLIVGARLIGKVESGRIAMSFAGATDKVKKYLGLALIPQAGVAVGLILLVQEDSAFTLEFRQLFLAIGLTVVTCNEIIGPILTRVALGRSGDLGKDRARLIDFLHEENIVTGLKADSKEEAIGKLIDLLIRSHNLKVDRETLMDSVMAREEEASTCFGSGFAIPHGELPDGKNIVGVMGISTEGITCDTPDGVPVHCMVLLATPSDQRDRHLEVLAALAKAVGTDPNVQRQLYNAKSAAHAYELLHAEESEGFNYFLEDEATA